MMILRLLRKDPRRLVIETLYQRIAAASRKPFLYLDFGVPDTVEGRFEAIVLHMTLILRRLRDFPEPAEGVAQDLVDCLFRHLDASLRELGVGDLAVPKRMKKLAAAFNGRSQAYDAALAAEGDEDLARALARNVLGRAEPARDFAAYVRRSETVLAALDLNALLTQGPQFAGPLAVAQEAAP